MFRFLAVVSAVCVLTSSAALADSTPIPSAATAPGSDPGHQTPIELLAGQIASHIAGRTVRIECQNPNDWRDTGALYGFDPAWALGYVRWPGDVAYLAPSICTSLQQFAAADPKPTKCVGSTTTADTVYRAVRSIVRTRVQVRVRAHGHWLWHWRVRTVTRTRKVATIVKHRLVSPPAPCTLDGQPAATMSSASWSEYDQYATAMLILAHEAVHLAGFEDDVRANCFGMQWMPYVAEQLGDTPDDAQALALYFYDQLYPGYMPDHPDYWSADCRENGPLDLHPNDGVWP